MAEIRIDPITGLRALIASRDDTTTTPLAHAGCRTLAVTHPLLHDDAPDPPPQDSPDLFGALAARGADERLVIDAGSASSLAELEADELEAAAETWRERMRAHDDAAYVHLGI